MRINVHLNRFMNENRKQILVWHRFSINEYKSIKLILERSVKECSRRFLNRECKKRSIFAPFFSSRMIYFQNWSTNNSPDFLKARQVVCTFSKYISFAICLKTHHLLPQRLKMTLTHTGPIWDVGKFMLPSCFLHL